MPIFALSFVPAVALGLAQEPTPEPAPEAEPTAEVESTAEAEPTEDATPAPAPAPAPAVAPAPAPAPEDLKKFNQWAVLIAPGGTYIKGQGWTAGGPLFRLNAWVHGWRGKFLIGGGPSLHYSLLLDRDQDDQIHFFTVNGDMIIGGGMPGKFAVYGHLTLGLGVLRAHDGATDLTLTLPGGRAGAGLGGHGYITPRISLGALVDFGYLGGLGVDAMAVLGIHFGRKPK